MLCDYIFHYACPTASRYFVEHPVETVKSVDFDVFCVGGEQSHPGFVKAIEWCEARGIQIYRMPRTTGISTTELKNRIKNEC